MSEPSKEALDRANAVGPSPITHEALQKAHDLLGYSPDDPERQRNPAGIGAYRIAAALQACMNERDAVKRAIQDVVATLASVEARAEAAEAKLAECARRVREWTELWNDGATTVSGLCAILDDYEPKTEEPGR